MNSRRRLAWRPKPARRRLAALILAISGIGGLEDSALAQSPSIPSTSGRVVPDLIARGMETAPPSVDGFAAISKPSGFFQVAFASIFGPSDYAPWRPLPLRTLFTEGWDEAWIAEPNDSGDAQQGWINAADGNFYRLSFFSYLHTHRLAQGGNGNSGSYTLYTPLNRRFELITFIPFVTSQPLLATGKQGFPNPMPSDRRPQGTGFGDLAFTPRVMLADSEYVGVNAQMTIQVPTGDRKLGAGQTIITPGAQFWWNFAENWVMRGGFNAGVGANRQSGGTTLVSQYAIGRTFTDHDVPLVGDLTFYLSTNVFNTVSSSQTLMTLTPGFRTHLGKDWYALAGLEVPVTGPRPYEENAIAWLMKTF